MNVYLLMSLSQANGVSNAAKNPMQTEMNAVFLMVFETTEIFFKANFTARTGNECMRLGVAKQRM